MIYSIAKIILFKRCAIEYNAGKGRMFFSAAVLLLIALGALASSYTVRVGVAEVIKSEIKPLSENETNNFLALGYDIYNSGSAGYSARLRLDVYNGTESTGNEIATVWSREVPLLPGEHKTVQLYWYAANMSRNLTAKIRAYRANEIEDAGQIAVAADAAKSGESRSIFTIEKIRVYDSTIKVRLRSSEDAGSAVVYPVNYPKGWIFGQEKTGGIASGKSMWVTLDYEPSLFSEQDVRLAVAGDSGKYYSEYDFKLRKEAGLLKYLHLAEDLFA